MKDNLFGNINLPSSEAILKDLAKLDKGDYNYSVADFCKKPSQFSFQFSPNGLYFSYQEKDEYGKSHVYVKNTKTDEVKMAIKEDQELIRGYGWASSNRLVYLMDKGGDENYHLFAVDLDGSNLRELTPFENCKVGVLESLKDQPDFMIVSMNKDNPQVFEPYKINILTGEYTKLFSNDDLSNPIVGYNFDKDGILRGYTKQQNGTEYIQYYKASNQDDYQTILKTSWKDTFAIIGFDYEDENLDTAYVVSNLENDTSEILLYDFKKKQEVRKIYRDKTYDVAGLHQSRKRNYEVDYYFYSGEKDVIVPVSESYKDLHQKFQNQFKDKSFSITSVTDNEDKFLIFVNSDKIYGIYFMYDANKDDFKEIMNLLPDLKEEDMAEMRPIKFEARDGLVLHGYLSIPKGTSENNKSPLIVNPHGGPYGPRDHWGFNPYIQLFANRGYATLQINYRGSGGYGKQFSLAGNKQIGRKMLNDLEDGVAYAISLNLIDKEKVAIYGGSYGGLATLGSLVKTPDLYTCGVDYVGVSNLFTFFNSIPPYWKPYKAQIAEQWYDENNPEEVEIMKAVSPALHVDKITKPLFIVQGANDPRVKIGEADQMVENLRARNVEVPYMVKYDEGHGFGHEANRIELYECMMGFFAKHLK